jgi:hypothetical protein
VPFKNLRIKATHVLAYPSTLCMARSKTREIVPFVLKTA